MYLKKRFSNNQGIKIENYRNESYFFIWVELICFQSQKLKTPYQNLGLASIRLRLPSGLPRLFFNYRSAPSYHWPPILRFRDRKTNV